MNKQMADKRLHYRLHQTHNRVKNVFTERLSAAVNLQPRLIFYNFLGASPPVFKEPSVMKNIHYPWKDKDVLYTITHFKKPKCYAIIY